LSHDYRYLAALGPGDARFFASGFRRVEHEIRDVTVSDAAAADPGVRATTTLRYPVDWSKKREEFDLPPHVSTVDIIVLGIQLCEAFLAHALGLDEASRRRVRLRKLTVRAGTRPQENLVDLPAVALLRHIHDGPAGTRVSTFDTSVGAMSARVELEHDIGVAVTGSGTFRTLSDVLGDGRSRYYGEGFKARRQIISDVSADVDRLTARASVGVEQLPGTVFTGNGIGGEFAASSFTPVDCFVTNLQLVQVLLYELDSVNRKESNTLWMLRTVLSVAPDSRPVGPVAQAQVTGRRLLPLRGGLWRNVDIEANLGDIDMLCSFAHELPPEAAARAAVKISSDGARG